METEIKIIGGLIIALFVLMAWARAREARWLRRRPGYQRRIRDRQMKR
jgi:hypothetical protein